MHTLVVVNHLLEMGLKGYLGHLTRPCELHVFVNTFVWGLLPEDRDRPASHHMRVLQVAHLNDLLGLNEVRRIALVI